MQAEQQLVAHQWANIGQVSFFNIVSIWANSHCGARDRLEAIINGSKAKNRALVAFLLREPHCKHITKLLESAATHKALHIGEPFDVAEDIV